MTSGFHIHDHEISKLDEVHARFVADWDAGRRPEIDAFLCGAGDRRLDLLSELIRLDLSFRIRNGESRRIEAYVDRFPEIRFQQKTFVELIVFEYWIRRREQQDVTTSEYARRFPNYADLLSKKLSEESIDDCATIYAECQAIVKPDQQIGFSSPQIEQRFKPLRRLGGGTFGEVYLATDKELNRDVAIKLPKRGMHFSRADLKMYSEEARFLAVLDHPGIVSVYDILWENSSVFIVSQFIRGQDLATRLKQGKISVRSTIEIAIGISDALGHAHQRGIIHRDVKPANILLDTEGNPFIVDFGLAQFDQRFVKAQGFVGTPAYASPEQIRSDNHLIGPHSDIFSFGIVFYEMICGQRPFNALSISELSSQICNGKYLDLRSVDPSIPDEIVRICNKCLAVRMRQRYQSAMELCTDLKVSLAEPYHYRTRTTPSSVPIPRGLRSFDERDAAGFVSLVPGERNRDEVPEPIEFWLSGVQRSMPTGFRVGVLSGPSGCGKSSLFKAGIIPRLADGIVPVFVEASPDGLIDQLKLKIGSSCPGLNASLDLESMLRCIRDEWSENRNRKLLIVIDQLEQWLVHHHLSQTDELTDCLRQCDGDNVQMVLLCREEYLIPTIRVLNQIDVRLYEGENFATYGHFDREHATDVVRRLGSALNKLPAPGENLSAKQAAFLKAAIETMVHSGEVSAVRLAVFIQLFRDRPWEPDELQVVESGIEFAFLNETFHGSIASPRIRHSASGAQTVLRQLLPAIGTNIKQARKGITELQRSLEGELDEERIQELLDLLNLELRLITVTDSEVSSGKGYVQLSHDYLVGVIRDWINQTEEATARGRARLRLEEISKQWAVSKEKRHLPTLFDWLQIHALTAPSRRTEPQKRMVTAANHYFGIRTALTAVALITVVVTANLVWSYESSRNLINDLTHSKAARPELIDRIQTQPMFAKSFLEAEFDDENINHLLAAQRLGKQHQLRIAEELLDSNPRQIQVICGILRDHRFEKIEARMWDALQQELLSTSQRFNAALTLSKLVGSNINTDSRWRASTDFVAKQLVSVALDSVRDAEVVVDLLHPGSDALFDSLKRVCADDPDRKRRWRATHLASEFYSLDASKLTELVRMVDGDELEILLSPVQELSRSDESVVELLKEIQSLATLESLPDLKRWAVIPKKLALAFKLNGGVVADRFAFHPGLDLNSFEQAISQLSQFGYRPTCCRTFVQNGRTLFTTLWYRDGLPFELIVDATEEFVREKHSEFSSKQLIPADLVGYTNGSDIKYACIWGPPANRYEATKHTLHFSIKLSNDGLRKEIRNAHNDDRYLKRFAVVSGINHVLTGISRVCPNASERAISMSKTDALIPELVKTFDSMDLFEIERIPILLYRRQFDMESLLSTDLSVEAMETIGMRYSNEGFMPVAVAQRQEMFSDAQTNYSVIWRRSGQSEQVKDKVARARTNAMLVLFRLGQPKWVRVNLVRSEDPRMRTYLIHGLSRVIEPDDLWQDVLNASDSGVRQALILALSEFSALETTIRDERLAQLIDIFQNDSDPGVHSASELILRRIDRYPINGFDTDPTSSLVNIDDQNDRSRRWSVNSIGLTMVELEPSNVFVSGSPPSEPYHDARTERQTVRNIRHRFAISSTEVTLGQFREFIEEAYNRRHKVDSIWNSKDDEPAGSVPWVQSTLFCNWLSEKEGLDLCYPVEIAEKAVFAKDFASRNGYRLPSQAEWEYACRGGSTTPRFYGFDDSLLTKYAWIAQNSGEHAHPVGLLLPNQWGLFGLYGNASEWCFDALASDSYLLTSNYRVLRGGTAGWGKRNARSAFVNGADPLIQGHEATTHFGFRVVRTLPPIENKD